MSTDPTARDQRLLRLLSAVVVVCAGVFALKPISSGDTYWHLTAGKTTAQHGYWWWPEPVGLTALEEWCNHYWATNLPAWLIWEAGGPVGLGIVTALFAAMAAAAVLWLARVLAPGAPWTALGFGAIAIAGFHYRFAARPQAFFLLMVPLGMLVGHRWARPERLSRAVIAGTALFLLLWAHGHASATIAPLFLAGLAFGVVVGLDGSLTLTGFTRRRLAAFVGVSLIPIVLGPKGLGSLGLVSSHSAGDTVQHIAEMQAMPLDAWWPPMDAPLLIAEALTLLAVVGMVRKRRFELGPLALAVLGLMLAATTLRFRAVWCVLAVPAVLAAWAPAREEITHKLLGGAATGVALLLLVLASPSPGLGVVRGNFPVGATDFLRAADFSGPVFAGSRAGGYVGWELQGAAKIPIDGRNPLLFNSEEYYAARRAMTDMQPLEVLDRRWGFGAVITYKNQPVCDGLVASPEWIPVYVGPIFALFGREGSDLAAQPLTALEPCGRTSQVVRCRTEPGYGDRARAEIARLSAIVPDEPWLHRLDAMMAMQCPSPDAAGAGVALERAAALDADHPDLPWLRGQLFVLAGDEDGALRALEGVDDHYEAGMLRLRLLKKADRPADALPLAKALLVQEDDAAPIPLRELGAWACDQTGDDVCATVQAYRATVEGSTTAPALLRRLLDEGRVPTHLVPVAQGALNGLP